MRIGCEGTARFGQQWTRRFDRIVKPLFDGHIELSANVFGHRLRVDSSNMFTHPVSPVLNDCLRQGRGLFEPVFEPIFNVFSVVFLLTGTSPKFSHRV